MREESELTTWIMIVFLAGLVLFQGLLSFFVVGDKGQPSWDYRQIKDVPGQSPYAVYELLPDPQHVRGIKGE